MKRLLIILVITLCSITTAHAKGGSVGHATMAHATTASHMMVHGSSHQPDNLTGRKMTENETIGGTIIFFAFVIIVFGAAVAWSGE